MTGVARPAPQSVPDPTKPKLGSSPFAGVKTKASVAAPAPKVTGKVTVPGANFPVPLPTYEPKMGVATAPSKPLVGRRGGGGLFGTDALTPGSFLTNTGTSLNSLIAGTMSGVPASADVELKKKLTAELAVGALPGIGSIYGPNKITKEQVDRWVGQAQGALSDGAWTAQDRLAIQATVQKLADRATRGDADVRDLNNWSIKAEYRRLLSQEKKVHNKDRDLADFGQGGFFDTYKGALTSSDQDYYGPGFILSEDAHGWMYITDIDDLVTNVSSTMRANPAAAGEMMTRLAAWQAYGGGAEQYVAGRIQFDANGRPIKGNWAKDDQLALRQFLGDVALVQAGAGPDLKPWTQTLDEVANQSADMGAQKGYGAGGGGGGGGYRGGGGGGAAAGVSYTPADMLKQLINSIARARLGQALSDADIQAFVTDYHQREAAFVNARMAGQDAMQLDPESAAAAWIENRFRDQMAAQAGNSFITELTKFLLGGGMAAGATQ